PWSPCTTPATTRPPSRPWPPSSRPAGRRFSSAASSATTATSTGCSLAWKPGWAARRWTFWSTTPASWTPPPSGRPTPSPPPPPLGQVPPEAFDRSYAVNVRAPFFIIQRALPWLRDGGRIINVSSATTRIASPFTHYAMGKGAIDVLSHTLAQALGPRGITVN